MRKLIVVLNPRPSPGGFYPSNHNSLPLPPTITPAQLRKVDPVASLQLGFALREGLAACAALHGPALDAALGRLDEHVLSTVRAATAVPSQRPQRQSPGGPSGADMDGR